MKFLKTSGLFLATTLILASCGNNQETVETTDAQEVGEAVGTTLQINTAESTVNWRGYKLPANIMASSLLLPEK